MSKATPRITGLDHIVLKSPDVERSLEFYQTVLGLEGVRVDAWRGGEAPFPSVRVSSGTIIDIVPAEKAESAQNAERLDHYCLVVAPGGLDAMLERVRAHGMEPGPKRRRFGAEGDGESAYLTGPEGVVIELRHYPEAS